jgi:hypothetical protein
MAVEARVGVGDRLEGLHMVPQIVGLDALDQLARCVINSRVTLSRCDRAGRVRQQQCNGQTERHQPEMWQPYPTS